MKILIINGVNLGLTGSREREIYGNETLEEINEKISAFAEERGHEVDFFQSDIEGEICTEIGKASSRYDGVVINAGAYSHYSIAIRDALAALYIPAVEVHMSNLLSREPFRQASVLSEVCKGTVFGFGMKGYLLALESFFL